MPTPSEDGRARALAGLRQFQDEAGSLRDALHGYEAALDRVCHRIETGEALHLVMEQIGVSSLRTDLVTRLTAFEAARHAMRIACFHMSLNEGLSIGDIAGLWGISRQLVSRMLNEDVQRDPTAAEHTQHIGLEQLPPRLNEMIAPPIPSSRSTATR
jgi:AraC-like DNA-binding protein